jgi:hypothetical protein
MKLVPRLLDQPPLKCSKLRVSNPRPPLLHHTKVTHETWDLEAITSDARFANNLIAVCEELFARLLR